ncbi:MAG: hypothetical protein ACI90V_007122 [Bacillariaceae sp.]|jgi:hypothetical protein
MLSSCLFFIVANGFFAVSILLVSPAVIVTTIESFRFDSSTCRPNMASAPKSRSTSSTLLSAHQLTTALEYLWEERISNSDSNDDYQYISWLDIADTNTTTTTTSDDAMLRLPLYPLSEVYLPSNNVNHTLNNVEPQNIQMALDIISGSSSSSSLPPRFCAVLRSIDTGRVAKIGNILRIINSEKQKNFGGISGGDDDDDDDDDDYNAIARICLTCQSEGLVEIIQIENGSGWKENRLRRSKEYLWAQVKPLVENDDDDENDEENEGNNVDRQSWKDVYITMREDFRIIKLMYQLELGADEFPPGMMLRLGDAIQEFPELDEITSTTPSCILWNFAQEWQSVCMTHKTGIQALLAAERNDRMVAAASAKGGPLMLPIHMEDLDPDSRWKIQQLDKEAQDMHEQSGMDPILDFQVLLGLPTTIQRFEFLAQLVSRERRRLEEIASSPSRLR